MKSFIAYFLLLVGPAPDCEARAVRCLEMIAKPAPKDAVIHLKWKKEESAGGWQWNVPVDGKNAKKGKQPEGPVTRP